MSFNIAFTGAGFILIGMLIKDFVMKDSRKWKTAISMFTALLLTVVIAEYNTAAKATEVFHTSVMAWAEYGSYVLFILSGIFGSLFVFLISKLVVEIRWLKNGLCRIGKNTVVSQRS